MPEHGQLKKVYIKGDYCNPGGVIKRLEEYGGINRKGLYGDNESLVYVIAPDDTIVPVESASMEYEWLTTNPNYIRLYPESDGSHVECNVFGRAYRWLFKHDFDGYDICAFCVLAGLLMVTVYSLMQVFG